MGMQRDHAKGTQTFTLACKLEVIRHHLSWLAVVLDIFLWVMIACAFAGLFVP
ncbi:MAG TPA: hypothetical protein VFB60_15685 [Ktedonobacteraceae bacterium]|nr:hypothetical protein [Ktedonobacteraceae bacterium]